MSLFQTKARASKEFPPPKDAGLQAIAHKTAELERLADAYVKWLGAMPLLLTGLFAVMYAAQLIDLGFIAIPFFLVPLTTIPWNIARRFALGEEIVTAVENRGEPDGITFLIDVFIKDAVSRQVRKRASLALEALLPLAQKEDFGRILPRHIAVLNRTLGSATSGASTELHIAIARALKHIGDAESLRVLEAIISRAAVLRTDAELVETAMKSLPEIKARLAKAHEQQSLLRASEAPNDDNELLRPSKGISTEPLQELLRPKDK